MEELKPCICGGLPTKETKRIMVGKVQDGGYEVAQGRFKCSECGNSPSWGQSYCADYGWDKNAEVWNNQD